MFEQFVKRPFHLALYRHGPYAEERSRFLALLVQEGRCFERLRRFNQLLLEVAKQLDLSDERRYTRRALMTVAVRWQRNRYPRSQSKRPSRIVILDFVFIASGWLRFLGRFEEEKEDLPYAQFLGDFFEFLRDERYCVTISDSRDVAAQQARSLLDVALRKFLLFPQLP